MELFIGTDPEVFVQDANGTYFSGHDLIPGTKSHPHRVKNGAIQVDGVALEFNTRPAKTVDEFTQYISDVLEELKAEYTKIRPDLQIVMTPTATFSKEYFDSLPEEPKELGCTPDYNAYTGEQNEPPGTSEPFRTGSGHIHVGWTEYENPHDDDHFGVCRNLVKQLDTILYPASLLWDADNKRRSLYGKIGAFRPKSYGVEYRPLSNAYLKEKPIQELVFKITKKATEDFFNGVLYYEDEEAQQIVGAIYAGAPIINSDLTAYLEYMKERYNVG